jgi:hypothetical protein
VSILAGVQPPAIAIRGDRKRYGEISAVDGLELTLFALVMWRLAIWRLRKRLID